MADKKSQKLTIDGVEYEWDKLSEKARSLVVSINIADSEVNSAKQRAAITQTARNAYFNELKDELSQQ
jgi:hypothetical protein